MRRRKIERKRERERLEREIKLDWAGFGLD